MIGPSTLATIAAMRESGKSFNAIAEATGVHRKTCEYHAVRLGAASPFTILHTHRRPKYLRRGHAVRGFTELEDQQITAWALENISLSEMGRRLGRRHNSIMGRLRTLARREALQEANHG